MAKIDPVHMSPLRLDRLAPLIGETRYDELQRVAARTREELSGATVWNANSTAVGGGVAEMLRVLVGYTLDAGIDTRWYVISGDAKFFATTKRLHNQLHGFPGSGHLSANDVEHYTELTAALGAELAGLVKPGDVVLLHDPQTAGMTPALAAAGAHVVWRCHIGADKTNEWTEAAWAFLRPHLELCQGFVFSRASYAPEWLAPQSIAVIPPSIDPFSAKNEDLGEGAVLSILRSSGILSGNEDTKASSVTLAGRASTVSRRATVVREGGPLDASVPLVVQVSRWDQLKDMAGVMAGFACSVPRDLEAHLALVGPAVAAVGDDPEGAAILAECTAAWEALDGQDRLRVSLVTLPMDDIDENAAMVNAIQRHATVVVQKSLAEGFGLTVAEAMWKARAVIASAVGGICDQIGPGTGILLDDPSDLDAFGAALSDLLQQPEVIATLGSAARNRVLSDFVGDDHLEAYAALMGQLHVHRSS